MSQEKDWLEKMLADIKLSVDCQKGLKAYDAGDYSTALAEFTRLAHENNAVAQYNLGVMHLKGEGVPQDDEEAAKWFSILADAGHVAVHAAAQYNLGCMYANGRGVPQNYTEAIRLWYLAAKVGHSQALFNLGKMYEYGVSVPQNYMLAYMWYSLSDTQGLNVAKENRDRMANHLPPELIAEAERKAEEWRSQNYKDC